MQQADRQASTTFGERRRRVAKAQQLAPLSVSVSARPSSSCLETTDILRSRSRRMRRSLTTPPLGAGYTEGREKQQVSRRTPLSVASPPVTGFHQHPSAFSSVPKGAGQAKATSAKVVSVVGRTPAAAAAAAAATGKPSRAAAVEELARAFADEVSLREGKAAKAGGGAAAEAFSLDSPPISPVSPARVTDSATKAQTLIILDWDDTLLPSRIATRCMQPRGPTLGPPKLPPTLTVDLDLLSEDVISLLKTCKARGRVIIVTNAMKGWVETSGKRLLPRVLAHIVQEQIPIVSAQHDWYAPRRRTYNGFDDPTEWKAACFKTQVDAFARISASPINLLSIGDSMYERIAAQGLLSSDNVGVCKTVKFVDTPKPTIAQLRGQITSLIAGFETIAGAGHSFDVDMEL